MNRIIIKQAAETDISVTESVLLSVVNLQTVLGQPMWSADTVSWDALSKSFEA